MSLEARLAALADDAFPPTPDLAARWSRKPLPQTGFLERRRRWRIAAALAALLLVPAGTVAAVELWGPDNLRVRSVETLPPAPPPAREGGEGASTLAQAADRAGFEPVTPSFLDAPPTDVRVRRGVVTYTAGEATVTQLAGSLFVEKTLGPGSGVERVAVDGAEGLYFEDPHDVVVETATGVRVLGRRRAGPTLVYEKGGVVIRVEGVRDPARFRERAAP